MCVVALVSSAVAAMPHGPTHGCRLMLAQVCSAVADPWLAPAGDGRAPLVGVPGSECARVQTARGDDEDPVGGGGETLWSTVGPTQTHDQVIDDRVAQAHAGTTVEEISSPPGFVAQCDAAPGAGDSAARDDKRATRCDQCWLGWASLVVEGGGELPAVTVPP